jgi:hypothetical protein
MSSPPTDLPTDAKLFCAAGPDLGALREIDLTNAQPALQRLGQPPFRKIGFPLMGFLATLYEHVSQHVGSSQAAPPSRAE